MKKLLIAATIAALIFSSAGIGYAATSGIVNVTVTITKTVSISIAGGPIDFGTLGVGQTAVASSAITVTNDGSGADETLTLSVTDPAGWTHGTPAENIYRLNFQFAENKPASDDANWKASGDVSETVTYNVSKKLWIKFETPTATNITSQQTIPVTITAQ